MNKTKVIRWSALVSTVVIGAGVYVVSSEEEPSTQAMAYPPVKVALAPVERDVIPRAFSGVGELEAIRQVQVAAETSGRITRINFESGQFVEKGELLLQLNDSVEQAELIRLQAQLRNAERLYARTHKLTLENAASREQLDNALAARDMALGAVKKTEATIAQKAIRAPFAGIIGIRRVHEGQYLHAADAVASLVDASTLHANFALDEQTSPALAVGQSVQIMVDAHPGRSFPATISAIDPLISNVRTVRVQATLANPDGQLQAGMYASIRVAQQQQAPVLTIPETAVTYTAYGDTVFVAQSGERQSLTAKRVAVKVGERWNGRVEIESGLRKGDRVVTSGQIKLSDGVAVEAMERDTLNDTLGTHPTFGF